jgi:hypothetical protein
LERSTRCFGKFVDLTVERRSAPHFLSAYS